MCDKRRSARSISVPGANNCVVLPCVDDVVVIRKHFFFSKHDRRGSIKQTDTIEMKNINTKRKTESDIKIPYNR